jgi:hypothetical protein
VISKKKKSAVDASLCRRTPNFNVPANSYLIGSADLRSHVGDGPDSPPPKSAQAANPSSARNGIEVFSVPALFRKT